MMTCRIYLQEDGEWVTDGRFLWLDDELNRVDTIKAAQQSIVELFKLNRDPGQHDPTYGIGQVNAESSVTMLLTATVEETNTNEREASPSADTTGALRMERTRPMPTREYIDIKDIATEFRMALKRAFPEHTCSVRIERFAGGSACDVTWMDGPTRKQVEAVLDPGIATDKSEATYHWHEDYWSGSHSYNLKRLASVGLMLAAVDRVLNTYADYAVRGDIPAYEVQRSDYDGSGNLNCADDEFTTRVYRELVNMGGYGDSS